jgi:E-phenylitaconyl-CoA hydratase
MPMEIDIKEHVATVMFNRPEAMNSIDPETRAQFYAIWDRIRTDEDIQVCIITGAGDRAFCTGADLKKTPPPKESFAELLLNRDNPGTFLHKFGFDKPIIAAVNGFALGGGMELALACDICIASDKARFGLTEARIGSVPGSGGVQRLPRSVSKSDAMYMILTGDIVDAAEAHRMGFVTKVVPHDELMQAALAIANRIKDNAPLAVRALKRMITQGLEMPLAHALEQDKYLYGLLRDTEDRLEGRAAFQQKRKPAYRGK